MKRSSLIGLAGLIIGASLLLFTSGPVLRLIQEVKYGNPIRVCAKGVGLKIGPEWLIEGVFDSGSGSSLAYGLVPVSVDVKQGSTSAVTLRMLADKRIKVSVHESRMAAVPREACLNNSHCKVERLSVLGSTQEVSRLRVAGDDWLFFLEMPLALALSGSGTDQHLLQSLELSNCS